MNRVLHLMIAVTMASVASVAMVAAQGVRLGLGGGLISPLSDYKDVDKVGWHATVNGRPAGIYRADVGLRGIIVPSGDSRVTLEYTPRPIYLGGFATLATFLGILAALWLRTRRHFS